MAAAMLAATCAVLFLLVALSGGPMRAAAAPAVPQILYVATTGSDTDGGTNDCTSIGSPCQTVQHAVSQANGGDEIRIAAGIYSGVSNVSGHDQVVNIDRDVILRGGFTTGIWTTPDPEANRTILDAERAGRVIYIDGSSPTIEGLILTGGSTSGPDYGAGVHIASGEPVIVNSVITDNISSASYGGGIYVTYGSSAVISASRIVSNHVTHGGGGISAQSNTRLLLQGNYIAHNDSNYGAGINSGGIVTATANTIVHNGSGSAVLVGGSGSRLTMYNSVVAGNDGRGVSMDNGTRALLAHNTIVSNTNHALNIAYDVEVSLTNNIIAGHPSASINTIELPAEPVTVTAQNNLFWNNSSDPITGTGALFLDPLFVDAGSDNFHLQFDSPAINQGVDAGISQDIDGDPRPIGGTPDLGADEVYQCVIRINSDPTEYHTVQEAIDASSPSDLIKVAGYCSDLATRSTETQIAYVDKSVTIRGGYALEDWTTPDPQANPTVLDARGLGRVVYVSSAAEPTIEGLVLMGGYASSYGGGVYVDLGADPVISGNTIISNSADLFGSGLYFAAGSETTLHANRIADNQGGSGSGFHVDEAKVIASDNIIADNGPGSAVDCHGSSGILSMFNNFVYGNSDRGVRAQGSCRAFLFYNTLVGNGSYGVNGINSAAITLTNNIIADHSSSSIYAADFDPPTIDASHNLFWNNGSDPITGTDALLADPLFVDAANGDYHLLYNSPAIDQGTDVGISSDFDGDPRPLGPQPDLGADEASSCLVRINDDPTLYYTVQDAIDISSPSDVVKVSGYCSGVANRGGTDQTAYVDQSIILRGGYTPDNWTAPDPEANPTVLDALRGGRVLYIAGGSSPTIEGLTLTGGSSSGDGGGIYIENGSPLIVGNVITDNVGSSGYGGGIMVAVDASPVISANQIISNYASLNGGGVHIASSSSMRLHANHIVGNTAGNGGALFIINGNMTATANTIVDNQSGTTVNCGGGLANISLINNIIADNTGAGVRPYSSCQVELIHNTLVSNTSHAVWGLSSAAITLTNNILTYHGGAGILTDTASTVVVATNNLFWENDSDPFIGAGAVIANPLFLDPANGDYHLQAGSPAIDQAVSTSVSSDIDGSFRPLGLWPDIGADEFYPCAARINEGATTYGTVQEAIDASLSGDLIKLAGYCTQVYTRTAQTQVAYLDRSVTLRGGYTAGDWTTSDPEGNPTVLDAQGQGRVVYVTDDAAPTLDGLIITGGRMDSAQGGGIYLDSGDLSIVSSVITDNHTAGSYGGGIYVENYASLILTDSQVISNSAVNSGGGIKLEAWSSGLLQNSLIAQNRSSYGTAIGGWMSVITLSGSTIVDNETGDPTSAMIECAGDNGSLVAVNNLIQGNDGTGISSRNGCLAEIAHNTIVSNTGNALRAHYDTVVDVTNNIMAGQGYPSVATVDIPSEVPTLTLTNNLFWNNSSDPITGTGAVLQDPLFVGAGDYHLQSGSPAINGGVRLSWVTQDLDGNPRPICLYPDIGAYEWQGGGCVESSVYLPLVLKSN
jgi:hypothetical protein